MKPGSGPGFIPVSLRVDFDVVDEPRLAEPGRTQHYEFAIVRLWRRELAAIAQGDVVDLPPCEREGGDRHLLVTLEAVRALLDRFLDLAKRRRQQRRLGALGGREITVT